MFLSLAEAKRVCPTVVLLNWAVTAQVRAEGPGSICRTPHGPILFPNLRIVYGAASRRVAKRNLGEEKQAKGNVVNFVAVSLAAPRVTAVIFRPTKMWRRLKIGFRHIFVGLNWISRPASRRWLGKCWMSTAKVKARFCGGLSRKVALPRLYEEINFAILYLGQFPLSAVRVEFLKSWFLPRVGDARVYWLKSRGV